MNEVSRETCVLKLAARKFTRDVPTHDPDSSACACNVGDDGDASPQSVSISSTFDGDNSNKSSVLSSSSLPPSSSTFPMVRFSHLGYPTPSFLSALPLHGLT